MIASIPGYFLMPMKLSFHFDCALRISFNCWSCACARAMRICVWWLAVHKSHAEKCNHLKIDEAKINKREPVSFIILRKEHYFKKYIYNNNKTVYTQNIHIIFGNGLIIIWHCKWTISEMWKVHMTEARTGLEVF